MYMLYIGIDRHRLILYYIILNLIDPKLGKFTVTSLKKSTQTQYISIENEDIEIWLL